MKQGRIAWLDGFRKPDYVNCEIVILHDRPKTSKSSYGFVIFSGFTHSSNCSPVRCPSLIAASRKLM
jgi:hypothetical protein